MAMTQQCPCPWFRELQRMAMVQDDTTVSMRQESVSDGRGWSLLASCCHLRKTWLVS